MSNPYKNLPDPAFWKRAVATPAPQDVDPVSPPPFRITQGDSIATAGSCFAQHISRTLQAKGYNYLVSEAGATDRNFGVFSARFGNIYTTRQLLQLFQRAYGLFDPQDKAWRRPDGRFVCPFRPLVEPDGYATPDSVTQDLDRHLAAVRDMFETCSLFVFTLGLTEGWCAKADGAVFPLAPGVAAQPEAPEDYEFHNFTVQENIGDLTEFIAHLRTVNPEVRLIFTVSPVPLIATYEPRHVLVSTIYSKSVLRVAAEEITRSSPGAAYFPSFEIITGHHTHYGYFAEDLRNVTNAGVDRAMTLFSRHYLTGQASENMAPQDQRPAESAVPEGERPLPNRIKPVVSAANLDEESYNIVCDEEALDE